jgi:predicted transport protein
MNEIEEIILLREQALQKLLDEQGKLTVEIKSMSDKLLEIRGQLARLGFYSQVSLDNDRNSPTKSRKGRGSSLRGDRSYSLEQHLEGKNPQVISIFHQLHERILGLGEGIQMSIAKKNVSYIAGRHFCGIVFWVNKLTIYLNINLSELNDPKNISKDCSKVGHWATGNTRFEVHLQDDIEYAMSLIQQSFLKNQILL